MFTGIVQAVGRVVALTPRGGDVELVVDTTTLGLEAANLGDSIAVAQKVMELINAELEATKVLT